MTVVAHVAHWYHVLLYLAPVLLVAVALWVAGRRLPDEGGEELDLEDEPLVPEARADRPV